MEEIEDADLDPDEGAQPDEYASREEAQAAISALSSADKKKLMVAAQYWWRRYRLEATEVEAEDLLQEAVLRTLKREKPRRWRKATVSIVKHLDRAMESIATHHCERHDAERRAAATSRGLDPAPPAPTTSAPRPPPSSNPESQLAAREQIDEIRSLFGDDTQGFQAVVCRARGMEASEIQRELGISNREWEAIRKRVQRRLANYLKGDREET